MSEIREIRAHVYLLKAEEGGRTRPVFSGYRPMCYFGLRTKDGTKAYNDGVISLENREMVLPGEYCDVRILPLHPEMLRDVLKLDLAFEVSEGSQVVGRGTVVEVA